MFNTDTPPQHNLKTKGKTIHQNEIIIFMPPGSNDQGHIVFVLFVCLSACLSVCCQL